ncbi:hypothetical protein Adt_44803 [Abeliophyllum distichum]|uniref:Uncharacterized protein n=1 Tax=Abeliophyllum distichum TaxID=126358 RepID=A0ABD1PBX2_9LAMI
MMQSCNPRAHCVAGESTLPKFNATMINYSRLIATSEEMRDRHSNNTSTRGSSNNLMHTLPKEEIFAQEPLLLGLGYLMACSSHGAALRTRDSPTGTRPPPCSSLLPWSNSFCRSLSY